MTNFDPTKNLGRLVTDVYTYKRHTEGLAERHRSSDIDMTTPFQGATTVQGSFDQVTAYIAGQAAVGHDFVVVGSGYDCYHTANGTQNYDQTVPSLDTLLNPVFQAIINGTTIPAGFTQLVRGGTVFIKEGTYTVSKTINVPPGIVIKGSGWGTKIINATNLNLTASPSQKTAFTISAATNATPVAVTTTTPMTGLVTGDTVSIGGALGNTAINGYHVVTVTGANTFTLNNVAGNGVYSSNSATASFCAPVFRAVADPNRAVDDAAIDPNLFMFSREISISSMIIADNFVEPAYLGDTNYKLAQNKTTSINQNTAPLVSVQAGANLFLHRVYFSGRVHFTSGQFVGNATSFAVASENDAPSSSGTILNMDECWVDGMATPVLFTSTAGAKDYLDVTNCKMRSYGTLNGNSSQPAFNSVINSTICNINVAGNSFYGNATNVTSSLYISGLPVGGVPLLQNQSRITFAQNNVAINKLSNSVNSTYSNVQINSTITSTVFQTYATIMVYGNDSMKDQFNVSLDDTTNPQFSVSNSAVSLLPAATGSTITATAQGDVNISSVSGNTAVSGSNFLHLTTTGGSGTDDLTVQVQSGTLTLTSPDGPTHIYGDQGTFLDSAFVNLGGSVAGGIVFVSGKFQGMPGEPLRMGLNTISTTAIGLNGTLILSGTQYNTETLVFTGTINGNVTIKLPNLSGYTKFIHVLSTPVSTNASITFSTTAGGGQVVVVSPGERLWVYSDGTNLYTDRPNRIIGSAQFSTSGGFSTTLDTTSSSTYVNSSITASLNNAFAGDLLTITGMVVGFNASTTTSAIVTLTDGSVTDLADTAMQFTNPNVGQLPIATSRILAGSGAFTTTATVRFKSTGGVATIMNPSALRIQLIRP